jgi:hypothetical protein
MGRNSIVEQRALSAGWRRDYLNGQDMLCRRCAGDPESSRQRSLLSTGFAVIRPGESTS